MAYKEFPIEGTDLICLDWTDDDWRPIFKPAQLTESERKRYDELMDSATVAAALRLIEAGLILKNSERRQSEIYYFWRNSQIGKELSKLLTVLWWMEGYEYIGQSVHGLPIVRRRVTCK